MMRRLGLVGAGVFLVAPISVIAAVKDRLCEGAGEELANGNKCVPNVDNLLKVQVQSVTDTLLVVAGAIAVVIIIVAGIRYITSTGDAARVKAAKDSLLYAVIGLIVIILAYAIVHFVSSNVGNQ